MVLHCLSLPQAAVKLDDWIKGNDEGFVTALFNAMSIADKIELKRLSKIYPNLVYVFELWNGAVPSITNLSEYSCAQKRRAL